MKPHLVGGACHRVHVALDEAMTVGELKLSSELTAHTDSCPRCGPDYRQMEALMKRLRQLPATMDLSPVTAVVDHVLGQVAAEHVGAPHPAKRKEHSRWFFSQVASAAAVVVLSAGLLTVVGMMVGEALQGGDPSSVLAKMLTPFKEWTTALFGGK